MTSMELGFVFLIGIEVGCFLKWLFFEEIKALNNKIIVWLKK